MNKIKYSLALILIVGICVATTPRSVLGSAGEAVVSFLGLSDTPSSYTASKCLAVNAGGTALEYVDCSSVSSAAGLWASSTDDLVAYPKNGSGGGQYAIVVGGTATTSDVQFEVVGESKFSDNITAYGTFTGYAVTATSSLISQGTLAVTGTSAFTGNVTSLGTLTGQNLVATSSLDIPSGAAPTVDAEGEIAIDTTSDQFAYYGGAKRVVVYDFDKSFVVGSSTQDFLTGSSFDTATSTWDLWHPKRAVTLTDLYCITTATGTAYLICGDGTDFTESIICDNDGQEDDGSIANGTFNAREKFQCQIGTSNNDPNEVTVTGTFIITAD